MITRTWIILAALILSAGLAGAEPFSAKAVFNSPDHSSATAYGFGVVVSADTSTVVVTALQSKGGRGFADIYVRPSSGWAGAPTPAAELIDSSALSGTFFGAGAAVSADGSTIAIAELGVSEPAGRILVFGRSASGWAGLPPALATLSAPIRSDEVPFGLTISSDGSVIVVGEPASLGGPNSVAVYVRPDGGWSGNITVASATLTPPAEPSNPSFGVSAAADSDGSVIVVGAPGLDSTGHSTTSGRVFVFVRPAGGWSGVVTPGATLADPAGAAADLFGLDVGVSADGSTAVTIGELQSLPGRAFVYLRPGHGWSGEIMPNARLSSSSRPSGSHGFVSVAVSGDGSRIFGGEPTPSFDGSAGTVDVYDRPGEGWSGSPAASATLMAPAGSSPDPFGLPVRTNANGSVFVTGTFLSVKNGAAGQAFIFEVIPPSRSSARGISVAGIARVRGR